MRVQRLAIGLLVALPLTAACVSSASSDAGAASKKKLSIREAEAGLSKMFTDGSGKADFSCADGGGRYEFICKGRYVPVDRNEGVVAHRIGASVSHYYEGEPVFAITVLRE
jgi:hypothetical protein